MLEGHEELLPAETNCGRKSAPKGKVQGLPRQEITTLIHIKRFCLNNFFRKDLTMAKGNNAQGKDKKKAKAKAPAKDAKPAPKKKK